MDFSEISPRAPRHRGPGARLWAAAALLVGLAALGCGGRRQTQPDALDIATDATYPPFESVDEHSKEIVGFDIDLIRAVAQKAGLQIEIVNSGDRLVPVRRGHLEHHHHRRAQGLDALLGPVLPGRAAAGGAQRRRGREGTQ
jgi:hypothetical protein